MTRRFRVRSVLTLVLAVHLPVAEAGADQEAETHVDSVSASVSGAFIRVQGQATFVDAPVTVAEDAGDTPGLDIVSATIARAPGSSRLDFTFHLDGAADLTGARFIWPVAVDGTDVGNYLLGGRGPRSDPSSPMVDEFKLQRGPTGVNLNADLQGSTLDGETVSWRLPMDAIEAVPGSRLDQAAPGPPGPGPAGWCPGLTSGPHWALTEAAELPCGVAVDEIALDSYTIPEAVVRIGIAPAGTPANAVPLRHQTIANEETGAFSGTVPKPDGAGSYVVVAEACYVADVCGLRSTNVTVP